VPSCPSVVIVVSTILQSKVKVWRTRVPTGQK